MKIENKEDMVHLRNLLAVFNKVKLDGVSGAEMMGTADAINYLGAILVKGAKEFEETNKEKAPKQQPVNNNNKKKKKGKK